MNAELLYTSAPEGLKRGSRGFCTVVATEGLPINVSQRLESLSGYRHVFQPGEDRDAENPVCYSHLRFTVGGRPLHVVSRIAAYGVDYSQRTNKIAHHIVVDRPPQGGPVPILQSDAFLRSWDGTCRTKPQGPSLSGTPVASAICHRWESITGDAGWGGQLAAAWSASASKPVWIVFELSQSQELLSLIGESIALLPEAVRWDATFSTYYTNLPPDVECRVRCVLAGSEEARMAAARGTVIHLAKKQGEPLKSSWVEAARTGRHNSSSSPVPPLVPLDQPASVAQPTISAMTGAYAKEVSDDQLEYDLVDIPSASPPLPTARKNSRTRNRTTEPEQLPSSTQPARRRLITATSVLIISILGASAVLFYWQYKNNQRLVETIGLSTETSARIAKKVDFAKRPDTDDPLPDQPVMDIDSAETPKGPIEVIATPSPSNNELTTPTQDVQRQEVDNIDRGIYANLSFKADPAIKEIFPGVKSVLPGATLEVVSSISKRDEDEESPLSYEWSIETIKVEPSESFRFSGSRLVLPKQFDGRTIKISVETKDATAPPAPIEILVLPYFKAKVDTANIVDIANGKVELSIDKSISSKQLHIKTPSATTKEQHLGGAEILMANGEITLSQLLNEENLIALKDVSQRLTESRRKWREGKQRVIDLQEQVKKNMRELSSFLASQPNSIRLAISKKDISSPSDLQTIKILFTNLMYTTDAYYKDRGLDTEREAVEAVKNILDCDLLFSTYSGVDQQKMGYIAQNLIKLWEGGANVTKTQSLGLRSITANLASALMERETFLSSYRMAFEQFSEELEKSKPMYITILEYRDDHDSNALSRRRSSEFELPLSLIIFCSDLDSTSSNTAPNKIKIAEPGHAF